MSHFEYSNTFGWMYQSERKCVSGHVLSSLNSQDLATSGIQRRISPDILGRPVASGVRKSFG